MSKDLKISDMSRTDKQPLIHLENQDLMPLPAPLDDPSKDHNWTPLSAQAKQKYECSLDDTLAVSVPQPKTKEEEDELVRKFLSGLDKLFSRENNWTFLQPLLLTMEHCAKCQTCSDACHIYEASGRNELYRPTYRSEILRRLYFKYVKHGGLLSAWQHGDIELNWPIVARLIELAYRCNLCRRCAQTCPIGVDNGLVAHELRKLFSQEMGIAAKEIHENGSMLQLKVGSSTGMSPAVVKDNIEFIDEEMQREDRHQDRDAVGRGGRRRPADPQRRRNPGLAREPRRVRRDPERRRRQVDAVVRARRLRRHQLRPLVRRRAVRARGAQARRRPPRSSRSRRS